MEVKMINNRPVKIWTSDAEESAMRQIENLTTLPFLFHHLAIMPDVHAGMGMPIGGVLACKDAVIPNAVGVDIGYGIVHRRGTRQPRFLLLMLPRGWSPDVTHDGYQYTRLAGGGVTFGGQGHRPCHPLTGRHAGGIGSLQGHRGGHCK